jgi:cyclic pyranopterin monophosphate synthase
MANLSHTDENGKARMVDTSEKSIQKRTATASGFIVLSPDTISIITENMMKKGDVLTVAEVAGIQAAKKCSDLVPLCHNITLEHVGVTLKTTERGVTARSEVSCVGRTGAEMEALTAVSVALLTVYDMCKAVDKTMIISDIHLEKKEKHDIA